MTTHDFLYVELIDRALARLNHSCFTDDPTPENQREFISDLFVDRLAIRIRDADLDKIGITEMAEDIAMECRETLTAAGFGILDRGTE